MRNAYSEARVAKDPPRRKVLIIEDEPSIRNVLFVLLAGLGCEGEQAALTQMLAPLARSQARNRLRESSLIFRLVKREAKA